MHLKFDLYDIHNNLLVSKNQDITDALVNELIQKGESQPKKFITVKDIPFLINLDNVFNDSRYAPIFSSSLLRKRIMEVLVQLKLEEPILLELSKMKESHPYTYKHVQIIAAMAITLISMLKKPKLDPMLAAHLGFTHDLGKTRIPDEILNKETALSNSEFEIIQSHPTIGYLLLNYYCGWEGKKYCWTAYEHHEKLDGTGYPRRIKKIDSYATLVTPIDMFDALISDRPYRRTPFTTRLAVDFLLDGARNGQLNKEIVYTLVNCLRKHKICPVSSIKVSKEKRDKMPLGSVYGIRTAGTWLRKD